MNIRIGNQIVSVIGESVREARRSRLFKDWLRSLDPSFIIRAIVIQSADIIRRDGRKHVLFLKIKADISDRRGRPLPGIVFLRGKSVAILPVVRTKSGDYAVLVHGGSAAIGSFSQLQLPAGMADGAVDLHEVARRELMEETGLDPAQGELVDLGECYFGMAGQGMYPSPGACDEMIHYFLFRQEMDDEMLEGFGGKETGLAEEQEHLNVKVVPLCEICRQSRDMKVHTAYFIYAELLKEGRL
jgi:8-oxo-dGTP pyrophosphatase MutT (NUDIX family)